MLVEVMIPRRMCQPKLSSRDFSLGPRIFYTNFHMISPHLGLAGIVSPIPAGGILLISVHQLHFQAARMAFLSAVCSLSNAGSCSSDLPVCASEVGPL